jgi:hypothetical protein
MTIKHFIFFLLIFALGSCSKKQPHQLSLIGEYNATLPSIIKRVYYKYIHNIRYGVGPVLILKSDSSYTKSFCGRTEFGRWRVLDDSLIVKIDSIVNEKDSFEKAGNERQLYFITPTGFLEQLVFIDANKSPWGKPFLLRSRFSKLE